MSESVLDGKFLFCL